ncbi:MAG: DUF3054 domain-containing protein [Ilumatobacteraceae bacterium]
MTRRQVGAFGADAIAVLVFAAIGRRSHDESGTVVGTLTTAAPFLLALVVSRAVPITRARPMAVRSGLVVWVTTLVVGMTTRNLVFGRGTAASFVVVAATFLAVTLIGWRLASERLSARGPGRHPT